MDSTGIVEVLKRCEALLEGHFELRSGLHSDRFFQCANVLRYPREAEALCGALVDKIRKEAPEVLAVDGVIAPAMGGIVVGHEVARALGVLSIFAEKQDGVLVLRRFDIAPGQKYLVAEDVITRGGRVQETIDIVKECGGVVTGAALLVDRSAGQASFDCPVFSLLEMAPVVWEPDKCPLCKEGQPLVHPGS